MRYLDRYGAPCTSVGRGGGEGNGSVTDVRAAQMQIEIANSWSSAPEREPLLIRRGVGDLLITL
jgi:hypothetical protein